MSSSLPWITSSAAWLALALPSSAQSTERMSATAGVEGNDESVAASISADGRFVAFESEADNLVVGDTNGRRDIFVHDRLTGALERVSVDSAGVEGDNNSSEASISADGRFVAFASWASNLVQGDTNFATDIFVHDRLLGSTERVSIDSSGRQVTGVSSGPAISADGRVVAFWSHSTELVSQDLNNIEDVFVHDRLLGSTRLVSTDSFGAQGSHRSRYPSISADGRKVAFWSMAFNLVPGDTNGFEDIFVKDLSDGSTVRVSVDSNGVQGNGSTGEDPSISANGETVAFDSRASNLVPGDTNNELDVFLHDLRSGITERVSVDSLGAESNSDSVNASVSADGRFVAFQSHATNLVTGDTNNRDDVFLRDRLAGITERVSVSSNGTQADQRSDFPSISANGRVTAFDSWATNLVAGDSNGTFDVFAHERASGTSINAIVLAGAAAVESQQTFELAWFAAPASASYWLAYSLNRNGSTVFGHPFDLGPPYTVIASGTTTPHGTGLYTSPPVPTAAVGRTLFLELGARDASGLLHDSIVHDVTIVDPPGSPTTERVSVDSAGTEGNEDSRDPSVSADGRFVAFYSYADNLVAGDTNGFADVFVHDRTTGTTERVSVSSTGAEADFGCLKPAISGDGRYVAFESRASNLVVGDTNNVNDIFLHDRILGTTIRVSVSSVGGQAGGGGSGQCSISADGSVVAFQSSADNLVPGDTNSAWDIFVREWQAGVTEIVSVDSNGLGTNAHSDYTTISADGQFVAFFSAATNLVPGDTNGVSDIFVRDRGANTTERVSVDSAGVEANGRSFWYPAISGDGRFVAFESSASNLVPGDTNGVQDIFVRDRVAGITSRVSVDSSGAQGNDWSRASAISGDGRFVAYSSAASNLVSSDTNNWHDVFVHDLQTGATERASVDSAGTEADQGSSEPSLSNGGRFVAFDSLASNLVPGDLGGWLDCFVRDRN